MEKKENVRKIKKEMKKDGWRKKEKEIYIYKKGRTKFNKTAIVPY